MTDADAPAITADILAKTLDEGIDPANPGVYKTLLQDLQGNILKGHGRAFSCHLFIRFTASRVETAKWIAEFCQTYLKSAQQQWEESVRYKQAGLSGGVFANFLLSCKGYEFLGIPPYKIPADQPFRLGIKDPDIAKMLGDPHVSAWESGFQQELHALILLADADSAALQKLVSLLSAQIDLIANIVQKDQGFILRNSVGQVIEHFGYVDGVSQPLFIKSDIAAAGQADSGFDKWDPRAALDIILVKDPNGRTADSYGSYLVYRKLEQNVKKFHNSVQSLAQTLNMESELAGAMLVGRFQDGTPVVLSDQSEDGEKITNNFNFDADTGGAKCPFHAHTRKTNPRGDTGRVVSADQVTTALSMEKGHRIARRAVSYGNPDPTAQPESGSGLLFICFQANIENQFNFIQSGWANAANFVKVAVGPDPLVGQPEGTQQWPLEWGKPATAAQLFPLCVNMQGGEYFFAPSIGFLANLTLTI
jgi:Dyp-type peroxidase family